MDRITLRGLRAHGRHGVLPREREEGQDFVVDVAVEVDTRAAAQTDDLGETADYGRLAARVLEVVAGDAVALLETLAERVAEAGLADPAVRAVEVTVHKPQAPLPVPFGDVAVSIRRERRPLRAVLSLGANLGDRADALQGALDLLAGTDGVQVVGASPVYETAAVGGPVQPDYLNAVVLVDTVLSPRALLRAAQAAETAHGRVRRERWGPRSLDVDVVAVGDLRSDDPVVVLPHPRAHERAFVLRPWLDADPDATLPGRGPVGQLLSGLGMAAAGGAALRRRDDIQLAMPR